MLNTTTFVGLDVHARSIKAVALDAMTGEVRSATFAYDAAAVAEWVNPRPCRKVQVRRHRVRPAEETHGAGRRLRHPGAVSKMVNPRPTGRREERPQRRRVSRRDAFLGNVSRSGFPLTDARRRATWCARWTTYKGRPEALQAKAVEVLAPGTAWSSANRSSGQRTLDRRPLGMDQRHKLRGEGPTTRSSRTDETP